MIRFNLNKGSVIITGLLMFFTCELYGNENHIVHVLDSKGKPIIHALVIWGENQAIGVDGSGYFHLSEAWDENTKIEIHAMGYDSQTVIVRDLIKKSVVVLQEKIGQLGEVVVAATRTDRSVENLPMPVTVISQEKIRETGGMRLSDVLREQTGLQVVANHGAGLQMQGLSSDYILILLDGEPLIGRTAGTFDLDRLAVSNIERIEILRGPSSAIYGSEAMAGIINIITKNSTEKRSATIESRFRSFQTFDLSTEVGFNENDWQALAYYNRFSTAGYDLNPEVIGRTQTPYTAHTGQLKMGKKFSDHWDARIFTRTYTEDAENTLGIMQDGLIQTGRMEGNRRDFNLNPTLQFRPNDQWLLTLRGMSSVFQTRSRTEFMEDGSLLDLQEFRQFYHRTEFQSDYQFNPNNLFTLGAGHLIETVEATRYNDLNRFDAAYLFIQHQWEPQEKWNMVSGIRADLHSQYGGRLSPKVSALYTFSDAFSWQASVGAGFKAPDFRQLLLNFNNASAGYYVFGANLVQEGISRLQEQGLVNQVLLDPSGFGTLEAEHSWALNTGFRWNPSKDFLVQANLFRNQISNLIETAPVARLTSGQNAFSYFNVARVVTQGAEVDVTHRLGAAFQVSLGYMFLDTRDLDVLDRIDQGTIFKRDESNRTRRVTRSDYGGLFNRSRHSGNIKLNYSEVNTGISLALRGIYRGTFGFGDVNGNLILDDPSEYAPGILSWNLTLSKTFQNGILLETGGLNLTNQMNIHDPLNPGRTFFAGMRLPFHQMFP
ncbi:TonB-dependent receptor plug domain-containing protein [Pararhodonellum marinum]|uniref:TonB-dependent receptor plug domain-containing protein n=1 Tax=Pararhodonellum marinum TaxID=2755358 RepID=UPI00188FACAD|nr:TonB-dependent receptor [Pararhodonellum marinum]